MKYIPLNGTENAKLAREKINNNFANIYDYLNKDNNKGKFAEFNTEDWAEINKDNVKYFSLTVTFDFKDYVYYNFFIYSCSDNITDAELVHCDFERNVGESTLIFYSDMPFKGWVSYA